MNSQTNVLPDIYTLYEHCCQLNDELLRTNWQQNEQYECLYQQYALMEPLRQRYSELHQQYARMYYAMQKLYIENNTLADNLKRANDKYSELCLKINAKKDLTDCELAESKTL